MKAGHFNQIEGFETARFFGELTNNRCKSKQGETSKKKMNSSYMAHFMRQGRRSDNTRTHCWHLQRSKL